MRLLIPFDTLSPQDQSSFHGAFGRDRPRETSTASKLDELGMGVLPDGTVYLNQRGLAALCGVKNAHIGSISRQWNEPRQKPRIARIKARLTQCRAAAQPHVEIRKNGTVQYGYPLEICQAVLEYYAADAGKNCQNEARERFRRLDKRTLTEWIHRAGENGPEARPQSDRATVAEAPADGLDGVPSLHRLALRILEETLAGIAQYQQFSCAIMSFYAGLFLGNSARAR